MRFGRRGRAPSGADAVHGGGPVYDAEIDNPGLGAWGQGTDYLPILLSPDPGGILARAEVLTLPVKPLQTPLQHSPQWAWNVGSPYPGPPATVNVYVDFDSIRWWGRTGQGQLVWSGDVELSADLPPAIPQDMVQHVDNFNRFWGGFPSIARNRPPAFGDQVPVLSPSLGGDESYT
jgi:hypothetical protein